MGERITAARLAESLSLSDLSEKSGISLQTVVDAETGRHPIKAGDLLAIANGLRMTVDELFNPKSIKL